MTEGGPNGEVAVGLHASVEGLGRIASLDRLAGPAADAVKKIIRPGRLKDLMSGVAWGTRSIHHSPTSRSGRSPARWCSIWSAADAGVTPPMR
jgi:hypothetical protein